MDKKNFRDYEVEDFLTDESFLNYCLHKNSVDEHFWEEWFLLNPEKISVAEQAKEMLQILTLTLAEKEYGDELKKIRSRIRSETGPAPQMPSIVRFLNWERVAGIYRGKKRSRLKYIVAALFIFCIGGYLLQHAGLNSSRLKETYNKGTAPMILILDDSSVVTLASHSSLRYPTEFGEQERKVYLDGEAGFQVTHNATHPFKVYENDLVTTVLGTIFNVKKRDGDSVIVVELLEGMVRVETINGQGSPVQSITLKPYERVIYQRNDKHLYKEIWTREIKTTLQNHIVFQQDNFETVAKKIKDAFGVELINQSNRKTWRFTGEFNNTTAQEVIENICLVEHLNSQVNGDTIIIR